MDVHKDQTKFEGPEQAGYHAGLYGPNLHNTHFNWFSSPARAHLWDKGHNAGFEDSRSEGDGCPTDSQ